MERAVAVKRLAAIFGKQFAYEINPKAPSAEEREAAKARNTELVASYNTLAEALQARRQFLLDNDADYQKLRAAVEEARKAKEKNAGTLYSHKIVVGTANSLFFHVEAQGDSWEQIFEKLEKKKQKAA